MGTKASDAGTGIAQPAAAKTLSGPDGLSFVLTLDARTGVRARRGRVFVIIARSGDLAHGVPEPRDTMPEPRDNVQAAEPITVPFFGLDVVGLTPGEPVVVDSGAAVLGYPYRELGQLPAGSYVVQGFLNTYETNRRADGSVVDVHWPAGDGGDIWHSPGNVYSIPQTITIDPRRPQAVPLALTQVITPSTPVPPGGTEQQGNPSDSAHVKHLKIRSALLSRFWGKDPWERIPRPAARQTTGDSRWTVAQENHYELAAGTRSRSQGQWDIWAAVFGPQGRDGYPAPIWDKQSGVIDRSVAAYWKTHFDLASIVTSNWTTLGPKLAGRMHFFVGSEDTCVSAVPPYAASATVRLSAVSKRICWSWRGRSLFQTRPAVAVSGWWCRRAGVMP